MTLEPPWNAFDLPEAETAQVTQQGLAQTFPGLKPGAYDRRLAQAGWDRVARAHGALQTTSDWERGGWRLSVNTAASRRTETLDVHVTVIGIPESERWTPLHLPLPPGRIVRDNGRELGVMVDDSEPSAVALDALGRLVADGWTEGPSRSARTMLNHADAPTLTVWAEPAGEDVLLHLSWGGQPQTTLNGSLPPLATPDGPKGPLADLPHEPLVEPWSGLGLPIGDGAVTYVDASMAMVVYDHGGVRSLFDAYASALVAGGWAATFTTMSGNVPVGTYERDGTRLSLAVTEAADFIAVALTQL